MVTLGYITNEAKRFHIFVAIRVQLIRDFTSPEQWRHIATKDNRVDIVSRGKKLSSLWWKGPTFLSTAATLIPETNHVDLEPNNPEVKKGTVVVTEVEPDSHADILTRVEYFSSWHKAKRAIAVCLRFKQKLPKVCKDLKSLKEVIKISYIPVDVDEMRRTEQEIIKLTQQQEFAKELQTLHNTKLSSTTTGEKTH
ncbi:uncharacterized protein LOC102808915 [Saccoglossus kowalevskii]|uniref:Uncharacterized protein LOC102808915 n=1 Tax=Saccoglossus kowalevskii TaxID=10224 RepID=A0ABM0ME80_SACKO|nr:PREDICTED: uncharacterized protein LOC102808915 [Saccoglossus kowalevskii]